MLLTMESIPVKFNSMKEFVLELDKIINPENYAGSAEKPIVIII